MSRMSLLRLASRLPRAAARPQLRCLSGSHSDFETVRKNRDACISFLVKLAQRIEREWDDAPARLGRLGLLRDALETLSTHTHADCRELAALAPDLSWEALAPRELPTLRLPGLRLETLRRAIRRR